MAFLLEDVHLPATLSAPRMTDDEFSALCAEHPDLFFEVTAAGELIVMPPTYSFTGGQNFEVARQLGAWARSDGRGFGTDSSTGFVLPNGARRSPDAAWILKSAIPPAPARRKRFWHLCPAFVVELRSASDRLPVLRDKMREWIANGSELAWLIDPEAETVEVYRPGCEPELISGAESIAGEGPVAGFVLELPPVWDPIEN